MLGATTVVAETMRAGASKRGFASWVGSGKRKAELLQLRLTGAEKQGFAEAADIAGLALSAWVRERLRRAARQELEDARRDIPFLSED